MELRRAHRSCRDFAGALSWALLAFVSLEIGFASAGEAACGAPSGSAVVTRVDERLDVVLDDGRIVRLGGLAPPDPERGAPETSAAARKFLTDAIVGQRVTVAPLSNGPDRWGRIVADLLRPAAVGGTQGSIAMELLAAGQARVRPEFEARGCAAARLAGEQEARDAGLGLWRDPAYAVVAASNTTAIRNLDSRFIIIEGRVRRVGFGRSRLYLDLGSRGGPTIVVARRLEQAFARFGRQVETLAGQIIRARGALDARFGPKIEVSEPAMIEIVRQSAAPGGEKSAP